MLRGKVEVIATDINGDILAELEHIEGICTEHMDVIDGPAIAAFCNTISTLDVLFNCAGYVANGDILNCNAICPGTVDSPSMHERLHATGDYEQASTNHNA